jgi:hypothetical protein
MKKGTHKGADTCSLYLQNVKEIKELSAMENNVFFQLISIAEYDTNMVFTGDYNKKAIAADLNIKVISIRVTMVALNKMNFIQRVRNNLYRLNPMIVWYGTEEGRNKLLAVGLDWELKKKIKPIR